MRVIKLGGRAQNDSALPREIARAWKETSGNLCVVHGGGDEITALQVALGKTPQFVNGRRVTTDDDIQLLRMVLSGVINKRLVSAFAKAGVQAIGISGEDGKLISARRGSNGDALFSLGAVGAPTSVNANLLHDLMRSGYMPVVSPIASDASDAGCALNVNGDDAAAAVAGALKASELLFVADVSGVLKDEVVIEQISLETIPDLIARGIVRGGMTAKLDAAKSAIECGVARVRISDIAGIMNENGGTTVKNSAKGVK
jgi:acetylglutamate kinase